MVNNTKQLGCRNFKQIYLMLTFARGKAMGAQGRRLDYVLKVKLKLSLDQKATYPTPFAAVAAKCHKPSVQEENWSLQYLHK